MEIDFALRRLGSVNAKGQNFAVVRYSDGGYGGGQVVFPKTESLKVQLVFGGSEGGDFARHSKKGVGDVADNRVVRGEVLTVRNETVVPGMKLGGGGSVGVSVYSESLVQKSERKVFCFIETGSGGAVVIVRGDLGGDIFRGLRGKIAKVHIVHYIYFPVNEHVFARGAHAGNDRADFEHGGAPVGIGYGDDGAFLRNPEVGKLAALDFTLPGDGRCKAENIVKDAFVKRKPLEGGNRQFFVFRVILGVKARGAFDFDDLRRVLLDEGYGGALRLGGGFAGAFRRRSQKEGGGAAQKKDENHPERDENFKLSVHNFLLYFRRRLR